MFETYMMGDQQLREMALNAMLLAVDAQAAALKSMDREHSLGVENSFSIERLRNQTKDLVQSAQTVVKSAESSCIHELREKVKALATSVRNLKDNADRFREAAQPRAKFRYDHLLMQMGMEEPKLAKDGDEAKQQSSAEAGAAPTNTDVAVDSRKLQAQAGFACLRAEVDEYYAYAMQVHATGNLALEYALNAVVKCSRCHSNI